MEDTSTTDEQPIAAYTDRSLDELRESVDRVTRELSSYTSLRWAFVRGIFYGLGTAFGASLIAAAVLWALSTFIPPIAHDLPASPTPGLQPTTPANG